MPSTVIINNLTAVHSESDGVSTAFPDVCKTPCGNSTVPVPYPNTALSRDLAEGSRRVTANGQPMMLKSSCVKTSTGDEAGSAKGVVSNRVKGKAYPKSYSFDVKVEGENVVRLSDLLVHNAGSPANTPPAIEMQPNLAQSGLCANEDPEAQEVTRLEWSTAEAWCGDTVSLIIETRNFKPEAKLTLEVVRGDLRERCVVDMFNAKVKASGVIEVPWVVRRGPYAEAPELLALQSTHGGVTQTARALAVKGLPDRQQLGPAFVRTALYYEFIPAAGPGPKAPGKWVHTPPDIQWDCEFDIEHIKGEVVVTRKIDFVLIIGAVLTPAKEKLWKKQIEEVWDHKFNIHRKQCRRGKQCDCAARLAQGGKMLCTHAPSRAGCCVFPIRVVCTFAPGHKPQVELNPGANHPDGNNHKNKKHYGKWWYSDRWWEAANNTAQPVGILRAHEFGHLLGLYDEYPGGGCQNGPKGPNWNKPKSIMGSGKTPSARHYQEVLDWFRSTFGGDVGDVELRKV